jgi:6-phosphogluconolactonase
MKFGKVGQITLVSAIALLVATLFTACGTLNVGFLFVATNKQTPGQIEVYEVDSESGSLRTIPTSPFPSGGRNPVAEVPSPDSKNLYVLNEDDNNVVQFGIGTDGKLYPQSTVNTPGSFPLAAALNSANSYFYGVDTLQPVAGCSPTNACPGDVFVCAVNSDGSLGTPVNGTNQCTNYYPLQLKASDTTTVLTPTAINITADGKYLYVSAYNATTSKGYLFAFAANSDGTLTSLNGNVPYILESQSASQSAPVPLQEPVALASDSGSQFLYVVDKLTNQVATYTLTGGAPSPTTPATIATTNITAQTGNQPSALTLAGTDFLYVANSLDSTVTGYSLSSGSLTSFGTYASDTNPVAITGDPRKVGFLYTVNFLGSSLSGYQINSTSGALINTKRSPYASTVQPTAIAGIPHGGTTTAAK